MRNIVKIGLFVFLMFLSVDSFGLASLAHTWLPIRFFPTDSTQRSSVDLVAERMEENSSSNRLFDYQSLRRIQTSA